MDDATSGSWTGHEHIYDVVIVGAGPSGLAVAARLREAHPSALFTDAEQARYHWVAKHAHQTTIKDKVSGKLKKPRDRGHGSKGLCMLVLDSSGSDWMGKWHALFNRLDISHLRSPMFFHPDPSDRDALLAFAHEEDRLRELEEIPGCVGRELSKHQKKKKKNRACGQSKQPHPSTVVDERDRKDYFAPSSVCFRDFCDACIERYGLRDHVIRQETVHDITYQSFLPGAHPEKLFCIRTDRSKHFAAMVVLAVGAGKACIPSPFPSGGGDGMSHILDLGEATVPHKSLRSKIAAGKPTSVLVIGGGLSSAQVVNNLVRAGVDKVWLLMRGPWKVKPFDVDLSWMSKFRNQQRATFWTADSFDERLTLAAEARNGGSMTPRFAKRLNDLVAQGKVIVRTHTTVIAQAYCTDDQVWTLQTNPNVPELPVFDHVYFATGAQSGLDNLGCCRSIRRDYPIEEHGGFPALTDDLQWREDVPLFVSGKLATLQLGPGAGNLEGARLGAERIAWAIEDKMKSEGEGISSTSDSQICRRLYTDGIGSKFNGLREDADESDQS